MAKREGSARAEDRIYFSPAEVASRFAVNVHRVLKWIADGSLVAVNLADRKARKPRWKIHVSAIENFERARSSTATGSPQRPARPSTRPRKTADFIEYY